MSIQLRPSLAPSPAQVTRAGAVRQPAAPLSAAEEARIADAFPARPSVAQRLYGPGREVTQPAVLGARLDLSA